MNDWATETETVPATPHVTNAKPSAGLTKCDEAARGILGSLLVVDDDEKILDVMSLRLSQIGHRVAITTNGNQVPELVKSCGVDLILMDVQMPACGGLEVLKVLRRTYSPTELPVIMVTGLRQSENIVEALELGANDYVTKPIDFPVVNARIQTQLLRKRMDQAVA